MQADGIYARSKDGESLGPIVEAEFRSLCANKSICTAYRLAGGQVYPIAVSERIRFDREHACSCTACNHCVEFTILLFCGVCTLFVVNLLRLPELQREREKAGPVSTGIVGAMFVATMLLLVGTLVVLFRRWRRVSTDIVAVESEV